MKENLDSVNINYVIILKHPGIMTLIKQQCILIGRAMTQSMTLNPNISQLCINKTMLEFYC